MGKYNIYLRKDGRYEGRLSLGKDENGKRRYRAIFGHSREEVAMKIAEIRRNELMSTECSITIHSLFQDWFQVIRLRVKESTAANHFMKATKHILPYFGSLTIGELLPKTVYGFIEEKQKQGLSNRYISDIIIILKCMLKYAAKTFRIFDPLSDIKLPRTESSAIKILDDKQQKKLENYIRSHTDRVSLGIAISLSTGIRIGELCGLQWKDIDLKKRILTVRKTVQRIQTANNNSKTKVVITEPKSRTSQREIPLPKCMIKLLAKFRGKDDEFVLSGKSKPHEPRTVQRWFRDVLNNAKLPSVHFHALRHMFATNCIRVGFDVKSLSEILGHSSVKITLNLYVHSSIEQKKRYMDRLSFDF